MKLIYVIPALIFTIIVVGLLAVNVKKKDTNVTREKTMVAMIMNGSVSDHSWGQSHYEGLQKTAKELNLDVSFHENIPADTNALVEMEKLIASGVKIIVANSFQFGPFIPGIPR